MSQSFDHQEFELLVQELRESNPDMQEKEILELASMVNHVGSMPEVQPPNDLFGRITKQIETANSDSTIHSELEDSVTQRTSLLNALVINVSRHMVPFSTGAVAMLVMVILFDGPIQKTESEFYENRSNSVQLNSETMSMLSKVTEQDVPVIPNGLVKNSETSFLSKDAIQTNAVEMPQQDVGASLEVAQSGEKQIFRAAVAEPQNSIVMSAKNDAKIALTRPQMKSTKPDSESEKNSSQRSKKVQNFNSEQSSSKVQKFKSKQSSTSFSRGSVRSGLVASLKSRKDDWLMNQSSSTPAFRAKKLNREISEPVAFGRMSDVYAMGSDDALKDSELNYTLAEANEINEKFKVLELRWEIPLKNLFSAREIIEAFDPEANHIRHLKMSNLEDYNEISGQITSDTYLVKLSTVRLVELMQKSLSVGELKVVNFEGSKTPISLKNFISEQAEQTKDHFWETQLIIIVSG